MSDSEGSVEEKKGKGKNSKNSKDKTEKKHRRKSKKNDDSDVDDDVARIEAQVIDELGEIDHILKRPDTFVGGCTVTEVPMWIAVKKRKHIKSSSEKNEEDADEEESEKDNDDDDPISKYSIVLRNIEISPGAVRVFREALDNAIDNKRRSIKKGIDPGKIIVDLRDDGYTIYNEGQPIAVRKNKKTGEYEPYMVFGKFRTSSNYNDDEERDVIGRNGYGITLANVFSSKFTIEVGDPTTGKKYTQTWTNNMRDIGEPEITSYKKKHGMVRVDYTIDEACGITSYSRDIKALYRKMVIDATFTHDHPITLNGEELYVKDIKQYASLYMELDDKKSIEYKDDKVNMLLIDTPDNGFITSFANGGYTSNGGLHVDAWMEPFVRRMLESVNKTYGRKYNKSHVLPHLTMFLSITVDKPRFNTQTKEQLIAPKVTLPFSTKKEPKEWDSVLEWDAMEELNNQAEAKKNLEAKKTDGKKTRFVNIPDLDDAAYAGGPQRMKCALFATEGKSAKGFAVAGFQYLKDGEKYNGAFPLRGKTANSIRNSEKAENNKEISNIKKALGLRSDVDYSQQENLENLRYGQLITLTDGDPDGTHITALLIALFSDKWKSLVEAGYIYSMQIYVVKAWRGYRKVGKTREKKDVHVFYTMEEYHKWYEQLEDPKKWEHKYYKGLGTCEKEDIKYCFENPRLVKYVYDENAEEKLSLAFSKGNEDKRKEWLSKYDPDVEYPFTEEMNISDFIDHNYIQFGIHANIRAIPSVVDGFTEVQRKIIYVMRKNNIRKEIKVSQLVGQVAKESDYLHGDQGGSGLDKAIIHLAQGFPGSNNIPFLVMKGNFGTRDKKGGDAASSRYIYTHLHAIIHYIIRAEDDIILVQRNDGDQPIEPVNYFPILPIELINGAEGIGLGYSTNLPCYNPLHLIDWIIKFLTGEETPELVPWYRFYNGNIEAFGNTFRDYGVFEQRANKIIITEIPLKYSFEGYKDKLLTWRDGDKRGNKKDKTAKGKGKKNSKSKKGSKEKSKGKKTSKEPDANVEGECQATKANGDVCGKKAKHDIDGFLCCGRHIPKQNDEKKEKKEQDKPKIKSFVAKKVLDFDEGKDSITIEVSGFNLKPSLKNLGLISTIPVSNLVLLTSKGAPKKYSSIESIITSYCKLRRKAYIKRKEAQIEYLTGEKKRLKKKIAFIEDVVSREIDIRADNIEEIMDEKEYPHDFLSMAIRSLTAKKQDELQKELDAVKETLSYYTDTSVEDIWINELNELKEQLLKMNGYDE